MANELFYPAGLDILGTYLGSVVDQSVETGAEEITQYASGDFMPGFVGQSKIAPGMQVDCHDISGALDLMNESALCRDCSGGTVRAMYRGAVNRSTRAAHGASAHSCYSLVSNALLWWESITAQQDEEAKIEVHVDATYNGNNAPMVNLGAQTLLAAVDPVRFFTLGPVKVNGVLLNRVKSMTWKNNVGLAKESANGEEAPSYVAIDRLRPMVQVELQDLYQAAAFPPEGTVVTSLVVFLRKRRAGKINVPNGTAEHIKLEATAGGLKFARVSGDKASKRIEISLARPAGGGAAWSYTKNVAIS